MDRPEDKQLELVTGLPKPVRQEVFDFLEMSSRGGESRDSLSQELVDSIDLKACLTSAPRI